MHHIHHTEGIILGSRNLGEAGKYYFIFTRDLGLITASAAGVRKLTSKLRFILQDFSYIKIDLVSGKDFWRITSASKTNQLEHLKKHPQRLKILANLARLLQRLLAGVEPNPELFAELLGGLSILEKLEDKEDLHSAEAVIVLRIVHNLGYIGDSATLAGFIRSPFEESLIFDISKYRAHILREINRALRETHL